MKDIAKETCNKCKGSWTIFFFEACEGRARTKSQIGCLNRVCETRREEKKRFKGSGGRRRFKRRAEGRRGGVGWEGSCGGAGQRAWVALTAQRFFLFGGWSHAGQ
jgi:hypothetical protein